MGRAPELAVSTLDMKIVSRFEANLLRILRYFLGRVPAEQALPLLVHPCPKPRCLSRTAVALVEDSLAKGSILLLARGGGWRRERHLHHERVVEGRLWQRLPTSDLALTFSRQSMRFLLWVTAAELPADKPRTPPNVDELTPADWLLFYYAHRAVRHTGLAPGLRNQPFFLRNPLCRLAFPDDFADSPRESQLDFRPWTQGVAAGILEALQEELRERWLEIERDKARIHDWRRVRSVGLAQEHALDSLFRAIEPARRLDLARFLLNGAAHVVADSQENWIERLEVRELRLAERAEVYRAALVVLNQLGRLQELEQQARAVGFHDEGYAAAQLFKADWEHAHGADLYAAAEPIRRRWQSWQ